ncbi:MAG: galactokinase [Methylobacter sp.]|uniref:galactokinase n=1 Tax=Methylobacter sp. TaxID=2051955 RepID=UPI0025F8BE3F|nr:galactokinase [Methylobacter sp.]MCK9619043.1 galactokinase [Methylobacter sp.]
MNYPKAQLSDFIDFFGSQPEVISSAPGRVNLLGEHTDYNDGFVLPIAIPQSTWVALSRSEDEWSRFRSENMNGLVHYQAGGAIPSGFAAYLVGCFEVLREEFDAIAPVNLLVSSDVPMGAGLSSSAALEVATLRGLRELFDLAIDDIDIALLAQQAEVRFAGVRCGIMDQMAASLADERHMLFLDTRTLERRLLPLPEQSELVVLDSGVPRSLAGSAYNQRRAECEEAANRLGISMLRDLDDPDLTDVLPEPLNRRARHVVSENQRVLNAVSGVSADEFGTLMNASHQSLRDDFEVSVPALDCLVELLQDHADIYGARLTGAGFGGACVALARAGRGAKVGEEILAAYGSKGYQGRVLVSGSMPTDFDPGGS